MKRGIANKRWRPTIGWSMIVRIVGYALALGWVGPAFYYNLDWHRSPTHSVWWENAWAIVSITAAALCFLGIHWLPAGMLTRVSLALGLILTGNNSWNAIDNVATIEHRRIDGRKAKIDDQTSRSSDRRQLSTTIEQAVEKVKEASQEELQLAVDQHVLENATKWKATNKCDPLEVTKSAAFCAEHARLKGLVATARGRDEARVGLRALAAEDKKQGTTTVADPGADYIAKMMGAFGVAATPERMEGIRAWRAGFKVIAYEAMAAVMPAIHIALVDLLLAVISAAMRLKAAAFARLAARRARVEASSKSETPSIETPLDTSPAPAKVTMAKPKKSKLTPEYAPFFADELETGSAIFTAEPTPLHQHCVAWCDRRKLPRLSQRIFGDIMTELSASAGWVRDKNGGYPVYRGVRIRARGPSLVVSNA